MKRLSLILLSLSCMPAQAQHGTQSSASCGLLTPAAPLTCQRNTAPSNISAKAFADFGILRAYAQTDQFTAASFGQVGLASASFFDTLTISSPNLSGQQGKVTFLMPVEYTFSTYASGSSIAESSLDARVAVGISERSQQQNQSVLQFRAKRTSTAETVTRVELEALPANRSNGVLELNYSFTFGNPFQLNAYLKATTNTLGPSSGAALDSFQSAYWGGIASLTTASGAAVPYTITSSSGFDYSQPYAAAVPEPSAWSLLLAGAALVSLRRRKPGV